MERNIQYIIYLVLVQCCLLGQNGTIDKYVTIGLESNLIVQENIYDVEIATMAISQAKVSMLPTLQLLGRYSIASGGRDFVIPTGTLLNPISENLNAINSTLTTVTPQFSNEFSYLPLEDEFVNFLREREYEVMFRVQWPILNDLLKQQVEKSDILGDVKELELTAYKKLLAKEIKIGYINYVRSVEKLSTLREEARRLELGKKTVNKLIEIGKASVIEKDQLQLSELSYQVEVANAKKDSVATQIYFNFLLNRQSDETIELNFTIENILLIDSFESLMSNAMKTNTSSQLLQYNEYLMDIDKEGLKNELIPRLSLVGDVGVQGTSLGFSGENRFAQLSLQLNWNILDFTRKKKKEINIINRSKLENQKSQNVNKVKADVMMAYEALQVAKKNLSLYQLKVRQAERLFALESQRLQKGIVALMDWEEVRSDLLQTQLELSNAKYDYTIEQINMEWLTGTIKIKE